MEDAIYICRNAQCQCPEYIWDVERDERGVAVGAAAKLCPHCRQAGHRMSDTERREAGV